VPAPMLAGDQSFRRTQRPQFGLEKGGCHFGDTQARSPGTPRSRGDLHSQSPPFGDARDTGRAFLDPGTAFRSRQ
jgi:hypothetical protein